jgi:hypothetical protein
LLCMRPQVVLRVISLCRGIWSLSGHSGLRQAVHPANLWVHGLAGSSGRERALWTMDPELMAEWGRRGLQLATENMDKIVDLCRE